MTKMNIYILIDDMSCHKHSPCRAGDYIFHWAKRKIGKHGIVIHLVVDPSIVTSFSFVVLCVLQEINGRAA